MSSHRCLIACGWIAALVWSCDAHLLSSACAAGPPSTWKVADTFSIALDVYPPKASGDKHAAPAEEPKPTVSYVLHAVLLPVLPSEECGCWKLQFTFVGQSPEFTEVFRLWIDKNNGYTRKASRIIGDKEIPLTPVRISAIVFDPPLGYPIELIPDIESATIPTPQADTILEIASRQRDGVSERRAILRVNGQVDTEIRQRWPSGAKWWSEYERFYHGHRELHARLVTPKTAPASPPPTVAPPRSPVAVPPAAGDDTVAAHSPAPSGSRRRPWLLGLLLAPLAVLGLLFYYRRVRKQPVGKRGRDMLRGKPRGNSRI